MLGTGGYGKVFLVRKICGADRGSLYAMKVSQGCSSWRNSPHQLGPQVLKKAVIVRKRKVMEHTLTERSVLEAIRDFPFLVTLHYAFQTDAKLHLIMGEPLLSLESIAPFTPSFYSGVPKHLLKVSKTSCFLTCSFSKVSVKKELIITSIFPQTTSVEERCSPTCTGWDRSLSPTPGST